ncbi:vanin-like protein 2 isoform X2 [Choristoneura fumiferana]|uniref:vanin-like protein 2 isoform X2 n=1 Tax=Choristoneura fumiferana TaxID=7141 RepID=UPI003D154385
MCRFVCLILACLLQLSLQRSTPADDSYVAAAVEYQVSADVEQNLQNYVQLIKEAAEQNADIIVFPELTLTRGSRSVNVPMYDLLKTQPIPALLPLAYDELLVGISTAARNHQIYVLINVQEFMDCNTVPEGSEEYCPEKKEYLFNTNVIFDRNGAVIDRYRKINLFGEFSRTPALKPDLGLFTTDFGVTFGHYICFDLMFQVPAIQVVEKNQITDVLFSTMWFSEMPYLSAVQIQEAYAYAENVNFIGAGANNVRVGSAGSGIYSGKAGALVSTMPGLPTTRLLVSRVPKVPGNVTGMSYPGPIYDNPADHDSLVLITDPSLPDHISRPLVNGFQEFTLVDKDVSCRFRVRLNQREGVQVESHKYRAFVQDGSNTYSRRQVGVAACLVVACKNNDSKTCAYRFGKNETHIEIKELEIEMSTLRNQYNKTLQCDNVVYFPSSFRINKFPLSPVNYTYSESSQNEIETGELPKTNGREKIMYKINAPQDELMSFAIWGRIYVRDVDHNTEVTEEDVQNYLNIEDIIYGTKRNKD